jgi:hypothetical protein
LTARRLGFQASLAILIAAPLSGPIGFAIVNAVAPQPPWRGAAAFVAAYHPIQALPFAFGFALVGAFLALHVAILATARPEGRVPALAALAFAIVFAALISLNYIAQTAVVPAAVRRGDTALIAALTMANPSSLGWAIEMFGYGFLGLASLCAAPVFGATRVQRAARVLLAANGVASVGSAVATAVDCSWLLTPVGLGLYLGWNGLVLAMAVLLMLVFRAGAAAPGAA